MNILEKAGFLVDNGQREKDYGPPEKNFANIAVMWSAYKGITITAYDVAMMMTLLKVARAAASKVEDTEVDIAGYARCAERIRLASARVSHVPPQTQPEPWVKLKEGSEVAAECLRCKCPGMWTETFVVRHNGCEERAVMWSSVAREKGKVP